MSISASTGRWLLIGLAAALSACSTLDDSRPSIAPASRPDGAANPAPADVMAPPADAQTTPSGLAWKVLTPGTGPAHPRAIDQVKVNYVGWTTDGVLFDASNLHGGPATFFLNRVIEGWTEGVQLMVKGEKSRFWIPSQLAYGDHPSGGRPAGMLVFEIELLEILP
jgi:FKBP-type peptidyl-prolyl cis-trans isomerase